MKTRTNNRSILQSAEDAALRIDLPRWMTGAQRRTVRKLLDFIYICAVVGSKTQRCKFTQVEFRRVGSRASAVVEVAEIDEGAASSIRRHVFIGPRGGLSARNRNSHGRRARRLRGWAQCVVYCRCPGCGRRVDQLLLGATPSCGERGPAA